MDFSTATAAIEPVPPPTTLEAHPIVASMVAAGPTDTSCCPRPLSNEQGSESCPLFDGRNQICKSSADETSDTSIDSY